MDERLVGNSKAFDLINHVVSQTEFTELGRHILDSADGVVGQIQNKEVIELAKRLIHAGNETVGSSISLEELDKEFFIADFSVHAELLDNLIELKGFVGPIKLVMNIATDTYHLTRAASLGESLSSS